jgi:hypothetical protein
MVIVARAAAVNSATHIGANAEIVTGKARVAVHKYIITAVLTCEFPAESNLW